MSVANATSPRPASLEADPATLLRRPDLTPDVQRRLERLADAKRIGVPAASKKYGCSPSTIYYAKKRLSDGGISALRDQSRVPHSHPSTTPPAVVGRLIELALDRPEDGPLSLSRQLKAEGHSVSHTTVQKILTRNNLGSESLRAGRLENESQTGRVLTPGQTRVIERVNPCSREGAGPLPPPGSVIIQDAEFLLQHPSRFIGDLSLHLGVDAGTAFVFGRIRPTRRAEDSIAVLQDQGFDAVKDIGSKVIGVITDSSKSFWGRKNHAYRFFLRELHDPPIDHRVDAGHGYLAMLSMLRKQFLRAHPDLRTLDLPELQDRLQAYLVDYNHNQRDGFPTYGKRPYDLFSRENFKMKVVNPQGLNFKSCMDRELGMQRSASHDP